MKFVLLNLDDEVSVSPLVARYALLTTGVFAKLSSWITNPSIIVGLNALDVIYLLSFSDGSVERRVVNIALKALCLLAVNELNRNGGLDELSQYLSQYASSAKKDFLALKNAKDSDPVIIGKVPNIADNSGSGIIHFLASTINSIILSISSFFTWIFNGVFGSR